MAVWKNMQLAVRFGFGEHPAATGPVWVDCTEHVRAVDGIEIVQGRPVGVPGINIGSFTLVLDNPDGLFDPENPDGPFFGLLVDGTPVQIGWRTPWDGPSSVSSIFRGFVESWPVVDRGFDSPTHLEGFDLLGLLKQGDAPATALHGEMRSMAQQPTFWWTAGPVGWMDNITGAAARHTGGLVEMDALVDGDGRSWGQTDPDGFGATTARVPDADGDRAWTVVSAFVRFPADRLVDSVLNQRMPTVVCWQPVWYSGVQFDRLLVTVFDGHLSAGMTSWDFASGARTSAAWSTAEDSGTPSVVNLFDGERHHLMVAMRAGHPDWTVAHAWVDGRRLDLPLVFWSQGEGAPPVHGDNAQLRIGVGAGTSVYNGTPYQGAIDHLMLWANFDGDADDLDSMAVTLHRAGRLAWAGDRLDQRLARILQSMDVTPAGGALDVSGITTLQGFRAGDVIELLQKIEDTEQGRVWVDQQGNVRFSARRWWWAHERSTTVQAVLSDDPDDVADGAVPMLSSELVIGRDPRRTVTVAQVTSEHGRMQVAEDQTSKALRGRRNPIHLSGLLHSSDRQSRQIAEALVKLNATPKPRVRCSFRVDDCGPTLNDRTPEWLLATAGEGALVEVRRRGLTVQGHVELFEHRIDGDGWVVTIEIDTTHTGLQLFRADQSLTDGDDLAAF